MTMTPLKTLLQEVELHSGVHLDSSLIPVASSFNDQKLKNNPSITSKAFGHMTSNQFIVLSHLTRFDLEGLQDSIRILGWSVAFAKDLTENFSNLTENQQKILGNEELLGGIKKGSEDGLRQLVVDVASVRIGQEMLPHLEKSGLIMCQSLPSLAYSTSSTVAHSQRLFLLCKLIAGESLSKRLCIKVPSTFEGLKACSLLEQMGINSLATTVFCMEQGLAAMEGAKVGLVSPYVRTLSSHFYESNQVPTESRLHDTSKPGIDLVRSLQIQFNRRKESGKERKTQMLAASFLDPQEVTCLIGIDSFTLSASILEALNTSPATSTSSQEGLKSVKKMDSQSDLNGDGLKRGELTAEELEINKAGNGKGGWLDEESEAGKSLLKALEEERIKWLMEDALSIFDKAEKELRGLAGKNLKGFGVELGV